MQTNNIPLAESITKEQAIELWNKFIESSSVRKDDSQSAMSFTANYYLILYSKDTIMAHLELESLGKKFIGMDQTEDTYSWKNMPTEWKYKTPYGNFILTTEESNLMRDQWMNRGKSKEVPTLEQLNEYLK